MYAENRSAFMAIFKWLKNQDDKTLGLYALSRFWKCVILTTIRKDDGHVTTTPPTCTEVPSRTWRTYYKQDSNVLSDFKFLILNDIRYSTWTSGHFSFRNCITKENMIVAKINISLSVKFNYYNYSCNDTNKRIIWLNYALTTFLFLALNLLR